MSFKETMNAPPIPNTAKTTRVNMKYATETMMILLVEAKKSAEASIIAMATLKFFHWQQRTRLKIMKNKVKAPATM